MTILGELVTSSKPMGPPFYLTFREGDRTWTLGVEESPPEVEEWISDLNLTGKWPDLDRLSYAWQRIVRDGMKALEREES